MVPLPSLLAALLVFPSVPALAVDARSPGVGASANAPVAAGITARSVALQWLQAQKTFEESLRGVVNLPAHQRNFENTVNALVIARIDFSASVAQLESLASASSNARVREAAKAAQEAAEEIAWRQMARPEVYGAIMQYAQRARGLEGDEADMLQDLIRHSESLSRRSFEEDGARVRALEARLSQLALGVAWDKGRVDVEALQDLESAAGLFQTQAQGAARQPHVDGMGRTLLWSHAEALKARLARLPETFPDIPADRQPEFLMDYPDGQHRSFKGWRWQEEQPVRSALDRAKAALGRAQSIVQRLEKGRSIQRSSYRLRLGWSLPFVRLERRTLGEELAAAARELALAASDLGLTGRAIAENGLALTPVLIVKELFMDRTWVTPWTDPQVKARFDAEALDEQR